MPTDAWDWIDLAYAQAEQFWRDLEAEFGLLTEHQAAEILGGDDAEPSRLRQSGQLIAVERVAGKVRYPGFQFLGGRPLPVIAELTELARRHDVTETDIAYWLCSPTTFFRESDRPIDHLDNPDQILAVAGASWGIVW